MKGGVLFYDLVDKVVKFINLCDVYYILLLFFVDVLGFMIGIKVECVGIICYGVKMIFVMSEVIVLKIFIVVCKVYGVGLYVMVGLVFELDCCLVLLIVFIVVMGLEVVVNVVYVNKIVVLLEEECVSFIVEKCEEYKKDIDIYYLVLEMVIDGIVYLNNLCEELKGCFEMYMSKY